MAYKQGVIGFGYLDSVLRIEARPTVKPLSREEVVQWLDAMVEAGVDAWRYSVSAKLRLPWG